MTLVGATTENPYFEVNSALLSRTQVYELVALTAADVEGLLRRALEAGAAHGVPVDDDALAFLAARSGGDARAALNALELACETVARAGSGRVTVADAEDALQRKALLYDKGGDQHYDYISAWIKATRGSDPDASLYYLAAMLEGGEDPRFIARRMIILASEDVGNADPQALPIAVAAAQAVEHVGLPEGQYALAQAAIYLSLAPKSNAAARAIGAARTQIAERRRGHAAGPAADGGLSGGAPARARPGLRVPALGARPHQRPGASPRGARGSALLRAGRRRARAARAPGGDPARARTRAVSALYDTIGRSYSSTRAEEPAIRRACMPRWATRARCSTSAPAPAPTSRATGRSSRSSRRR